MLEQNPPAAGVLVSEHARNHLHEVFAADLT